MSFGLRELTFSQWRRLASAARGAPVASRQSALEKGSYASVTDPNSAFGPPNGMTVSVALVVSPEHPHYRGGVTPGVLRRRAGPSGGLPPPGAAPLMRDLSRIHHRCYDQAYSAGDVPMMYERPRGALRWSHTLHRGNNKEQGRADMRERRGEAGRTSAAKASDRAPRQR